MRARVIILVAAMAASTPCLAQVGYGYQPGYQGGYQGGYGAPSYGSGYGTPGYYGAPNGYGSGFAQPRDGGYYGPNPSYSGPYQPRTPDDVMTPGRVRNDPSKDIAGAGKSPAVLLPNTSAPVGSTTAERRNPKGQRFEGHARVVDGNTLVLGSDVIVLNGADAPELSQTCKDRTGLDWTCGARAKDKLVSMVEGKRIVCVGAGLAGQAVLATCKLGQTDVGRAMVGNGWAMAPKAVTPVYAADEAQAKADTRGIWSGSAQAPWTYRSTN